MYDVHESRFGATAGFLPKIEARLSLVLAPSRCPLSYDPWLFLSLQITTAITITVRKTHRLRGLHGWFSFALILFRSVTLKSRPEVLQENIMFYACAQYPSSWPIKSPPSLPTTAISPYFSTILGLYVYRITELVSWYTQIVLTDLKYS